jgi:acetyl esterase
MRAADRTRGGEGPCLNRIPAGQDTHLTHSCGIVIVLPVRDPAEIGDEYDHRPELSGSVDAQTEELLRELGPGGDSDDIDALREPWPADDPALLPSRELSAITDLTVPGDPGVPVRIYTPCTPPSRAGLVWLHPGGFVAGGLDDIDGICTALADDSGCSVVSVGYRLAPEHPFPAAVDDTTAVMRWLGKNGATLGLDSRRIAVGGQSSGATIAAACAWRWRDDGSVPQPRLQVLAYPVLDPRVAAPSYRENGVGFYFTTQTMAWSWRQYLGERCANPPAEATPLYADSLRGVAPALLLAAGRDPARDDTRRYRDELVADGVEARLVEYPRTIHAFLSFAGVLDVAREALDLIAATLRERLESARPWLQHVTLPYLPGRERDILEFYGKALGLPVEPVPKAFEGRGFIWFRAGGAGGELHLIPEETSAEDGERHACLATEHLDEVVSRLRAASHDVELYDVIPDRPQAYVHDPCGNLLELTKLPGL